MIRWSAKVLVWTGLWAAAVAMCRAEELPADERSLWLVWASHTNAPEDHTTVAACQAFRTKAPQNPLAVGAQGLEAWHLLKTGQTNAAVRLFEPMLLSTNNALAKAGADMARGWLTRLDRELVRAALMRLYVRDIEFPGALEAIKALKGGAPPPFADRGPTGWPTCGPLRASNASGMSWSRSGWARIRI